MSTYPVPVAILDQHVAVLGKTRSGKSSVMRGLVEGLLGRRLPVCIVDPKGDWWGIKLAADGKHAGFPVVIFGGEHSDVPINAHAGTAVAELFATGNRPCLVDLGGWTVGDRTRFWVDFASTLFKLTRGLRWLVVDEVHNFCPKAGHLDPDAAKALHWTNRLASEGLGKGLAMLFASQRPQKVHNDTLTSAETLIAMRVLHPSDRGAVTDWVNGCGDPKLGSKVLDSLAQLARGEGWAWSPEIGFGPERVKFPMFKTYDSFRPQTPEDAKSIKGWAEVDLEDVKAKLATAVKEAEANDPRKLRAQIADLERKLAAAPKAAPAADPAAAEASYREGYDKGRADGHGIGLWEGQGTARLALAQVGAIADAAGKAAAAIQSGLDKPTKVAPTVVPQRATLPAQQLRESAPVPKTRHGASAPNGAPLSGALKRSHQRVIDAIGWWSKIGRSPIERNRACVVAGLSPKASTFGVYVAELVKMGLVESAPGTVALTTEGFRHARIPAAATKRDLYEAASGMLASQERKIFDIIYKSYPSEIRRDDVAEQAGLSPTASTAGVYMAGVAAYGIIEPGARGHVKAADWLFP